MTHTEKTSFIRIFGWTLIILSSMILVARLTGGNETSLAYIPNLITLAIGVGLLIFNPKKR